MTFFALSVVFVMAVMSFLRRPEPVPVRVAARARR